jgi:hypothetical protein
MVKTAFTQRYYIVLRGMLQLLVTANVVPSSPILVTLMMEATRTSETSVLTRAVWHYIPEDGVLNSHCHETSNLTLFYIFCMLSFQIAHRNIKGTNMYYSKILATEGKETEDKM